jgi:hypothetical protein
MRLPGPDWRPRKFETGAVYRALTPSYGDDANKHEDIYLILGPARKDYMYVDYPVEYAYLDLVTGNTGVFHRDSYFAEGAKQL